MSRQRFILIIVAILVASLLAAITYRRLLRPLPGPVQSSSSTSGPCIDFHDAGAHTGQSACVSGRILRVFTSRAGNIFLDFCSDYHNCPFSSVIFSSDRSKFGDLTTIGGHQVEIRGPVTPYNGRAEIVIHDPQQIRVTN